MRRLLAALAVGLLLFSACSTEDPEPTTAELLAEIEGRELTPAELAEREEIAALLCSLDDAVLIQIWNKLDPGELAFQDYVFGRVCTEKSDLYGQRTGRFASEESPGS